MDLSLFPANYDGYSVLIMILISRLYHCVVGSVWTCDQCGYAFNNAYELLMHMITDENCSSLSEKQKRHHLKLIPFNAKLAILGAVDWEGYGNQIEAFVDALENGKLPATEIYPPSNGDSDNSQPADCNTENAESG